MRSLEFGPRCCTSCLRRRFRNPGNAMSRYARRERTCASRRPARFPRGRLGCWQRSQRWGELFVGVVLCGTGETRPRRWETHLAACAARQLFTAADKPCRGDRIRRSTAICQIQGRHRKDGDGYEQRGRRSHIGVSQPRSDSSRHRLISRL